MPITYTPMRYPGGKSKLFPIMDAIIEENSFSSIPYAEAYCGGAGLAIKLLLTGRVPSIILNDIDSAVYSIWDAVIHHPDELCTFLSTVPLTIDEWKLQRDVFFSSDRPTFELGKAALYLNRTNRSGILRGGPIGGMSQNGKYRIDARFNRIGLVNKVQAIAARSDDISLYNMDACDFIAEILTSDDDLFANFDPPYVAKGPELYKNSYTSDDDHIILAEKISACEFPWIATYDDSLLIHRLYSGFNRFFVEVRYSAARAKVGKEVLIASNNVTIPERLALRAI